MRILVMFVQGTNSETLNLIIFQKNEINATELATVFFYKLLI